MFENFVIPDFLPAAPEMFLAIMAMTILMTAWAICSRSSSI
jgi:NADH-quinone oxidoreductase subunit N